MIHYHGGPHNTDACAHAAWTGRHAFVSHHKPDQVNLAAQVCQSFALDNGAFAKWKTGRATNWQAYYDWVAKWSTHPGFDWAVIPDAIGGGAEENDALLAQWPLARHLGAPVWHTDEPPQRLLDLCRQWPRVCIGSVGAFDVAAPAKFLAAAHVFLQPVCHPDTGRPMAKLHGLRMLNPVVFTQLPLASADSTNVSRNAANDSAWASGTYRPASRETRTRILVERVESYNSADRLPALPPTADQLRRAAVLVRTKF